MHTYACYRYYACIMYVKEIICKTFNANILRRKGKVESGEWRMEKKSSSRRQIEKNKNKNKKLPRWNELEFTTYGVRYLLLGTCSYLHTTRY